MEDFIDLEKLLGLERATPELRKEIIATAERSVYKRVLVNVLQALTEDQKDALLQILDAQTETTNVPNKAVITFLREHIPTFDDMVQQEIQQFKEESVELFKVIDGAEI